MNWTDRHKRELQDMLKRQNANFVAKLGREPGAGDPVFVDPTADEPKPMDANWVQAQTVEVMERADIHPALIHAYKKTGRIVSEENRRYLTKADLREWQDAIEGTPPIRGRDRLNNTKQQPARREGR